MNFGARDYREDLDALEQYLEDRRRQKRQQLKLQIASQCLAGILANNSTWNNELSTPQIADFAWGVATELMKLSEQEGVATELMTLSEQEEEK